MAMIKEKVYDRIVISACCLSYQQKALGKDMQPYALHVI